MKLLADTGALLALFNRKDDYHERAAAFVASGRARFVLTELILSETVTRLRARSDAATAANVGVTLLNSRRYEVLVVDTPLLESGISNLRKFSDKRLSLVDAVSFAVIRSLALDGAFTFDRDFRDCGFETFPV